MKKLLTISYFILAFSSWSFSQNALNFDGGDDIVQTNYSGVLGSANRTFEAWIYVGSNAPASNMAILDYGTNAVGSRNTLSVTGSKGLTFVSGGTNANMSIAPNSIPIAQWTHIAFVLDNGTGSMYVNGVLKGTGNLTTVNTPSNQTVRIGQRVSGGSIPFLGSIDEVRIWNVARTANEIQANMNAELCGLQPNLELYLKFNEGIAGGMNTAVTSTADDSGNGNNGTLSNFSLTGTSSNWITGAGLSALSTTSNLQQTACNSFALTPTSTVYTTSGIYTETLIGANAQGCDSIVTLDLTILGSTTSTDIQSACGSYTWIDGITYTADETDATFVLTNAQGCDSIVTLELTINNNTTSTDVQTICSSSYTWIDGNTYTSSNNTASVTLTSAAGCDSIITLDLTINPVNISVTQTDSLLMADEAGATYQWVECPSMTPISGATNQSFIPENSGEYALIITNNTQCTDTSACYNVILSSTFENKFKEELSLFPNPSEGNFFIDLGKNYSETTVSIRDLTGRLISSNIYQNQQMLNLELTAPAGVYILTVESEDKRAMFRLVKE